jgi:transposase InsO family protein
MIVTEVSQLKAEVEQPYRDLLAPMAVAYATYMRWKQRVENSQPAVNTPGPKKTAPLDENGLRVNLAALDHVRHRSIGAGELYRRYHEQLSRRGLNVLIKRARLEVGREHQRTMRRITWNVPGLAWAMDDAQWNDQHLHTIRDLSSRYTFEPLVGDFADGDRVAQNLTRLIHQHGPPLILKRDNGSNLLHRAVAAVLQEHLIIPLNSPPHYPRYNGGIERAQRELKALLATDRDPRLAAHDLNHRARPCLKRQTACAVWHAGKSAMTHYNVEQRMEIIGWINRQAMLILASMERVNEKAQAAAWRRAVETWLHRNGLITVSVGGQVLPSYP